MTMGCLASLSSVQARRPVTSRCIICSALPTVDADHLGGQLKQNFGIRLRQLMEFGVVHFQYLAFFLCHHERGALSGFKHAYFAEEITAVQVG